MFLGASYIRMEFFYVHSMYMALINIGIIEMNRNIWKLKMPLVIKIFMWCLHKGVVLTKYNLASETGKEVNFVVLHRG
jgi:hypothetical protein